MTKYVLYSILIIVICAGCAMLLHLYKVSYKNKNEMTKYIEPETMSANLGKVLVVYYSLSGKTKDIAMQIQNLTNGDIYEIKPVKEIKQNPLLYIESKKQISSGKYPEIVNDFPDLTKYDTIFVGTPIWWYTAATPAFAFIDQINFEGKNVVPFSTQGSNYGTFFEDFKSKAKNAVILQGESFNNLDARYNESVKNKIIVWLNNLK